MPVDECGRTFLRGNSAGWWRMQQCDSTGSIRPGSCSLSVSWKSGCVDLVEISSK